MCVLVLGFESVCVCVCVCVAVVKRADEERWDQAEGHYGVFDEIERARGLERERTHKHTNTHMRPTLPEY